MPPRTTDPSRRGRVPKTLAQKYCLLVGLALLVGGILGFIADATFDTGDNLNGDSFLGLEVNGYHNVVHLVSGIVLLAAANSRPTAKVTAIAFGVAYGIITLIGLIDGQDVLDLIPVNGADNVLHIVLSLTGIAAGLASATTKGAQRRRAQRHESAVPAATPSAEDGDGTTGSTSDTGSTPVR